VEWRKDSGNWIKLQRTGATSVDVTGIYSGAYLARVRSVSAFEISSIWKSSNLTNLEGKVGLPPAVAFLTTTSELFGIGIRWGFPSGAEDTQRTELWYGQANDLSAATKLADLAHPQANYSMQALQAGAQFFFWARLVDRTGNVGPFYPVGNGVMGQASANAAPVLELIAGQIGRTELGQEIIDEIDKIPGLQAQIDALDGLSAYDPEQTYIEGDLVVVGKRIYQATGPVPVNTAPPNAAYWVDVGQVLVTANGLARQVEINTTSITELDGVVTAQASSLQSLQSAYRDDTGEGDLAGALQGYNAAASFAEEVKTRASQNAAMVQRQTELTASVGDVAGTVTELESVVVTDRQATAQAIQQIGVKIDGNSADIQTVSRAQIDTDGKLSTMWSVKMQLNANGQYVAAGIGLGIENVDGQLQSQFLVSADRFSIVTTLAGGQVFTPFTVQNGEVFMRSTFIQDGTITNAKIGNYIASNNYVAGVSGWKLFFDGTFEINSAFGGQARQVINNAGGKVFDENGTKRYQWGDLSA
jgi:predicted phage tail protein